MSRLDWMSPLTNVDWYLDNGYVPEPIIRHGIRRQLAQRETMIASDGLENAQKAKMRYIRQLRHRPMAIETDAANAQHYEVEAGVLQCCLGQRMKYSCCLYPTGQETLDQAEIEMLRLYISRARLEDGMRILDLGCGWGSLSIFLAETFPNSNILAFSNSTRQREHIKSIYESKGLKNITVQTGDIVSFEFQEGLFDRVISIELFEHMKNYELLMQKIDRALKPGGQLFVHIFAHANTPYDFESGWMSDHFFTGGTMPSADLLHYFQKSLVLDEQWWVNGKHYAQTAEDWLKRLKASKHEVWPDLVKTYKQEHAATWFERWKIFFMACAELFAYGGGDTWGVSQYLFSKPISRGQ